MKKILLIRHGKSSWGILDQSDFDRPLKKRGHEDARMMGMILKERGLIPQALFLSTSERTKQTSKELLKSLDSNPFFEPDLYGIGLGDFQQLIHLQDDAYDFIGFVGHNPTLSYAIEQADDTFGYLPTAGVALIEFDVESWKEVDLKSGSVKAVLTPKMYRDAD